MPKRPLAYQGVDMTDEEHAYYRRLVESFTEGGVKGHEYFQDVFDADEDGCITMIRPPVGKPLPWAVIVFLQNLMINQQLRKQERFLESRLAEIESKIGEMKDGKDAG